MEDSADPAAAGSGFPAQSPVNTAVRGCGKKIEDFRRTMQRAMSTTGPGRTRTGNRPGPNLEVCKRMIQKAMTTPKFIHLREEMAKLGCNVGDNFIKPINCRERHAGHYTCGEGEMAKLGCNVGDNFIKPINCRERHAGHYTCGEGIMVCCNYMSLQDYCSQVLIHEMVHAYDDCRANVNWRNCAHHACAEIRANNVSGDCHYMREFLRGNWRIKNNKQDCVKKRSLESVMKNPSCPDAIANNALNAVWDICYNDTAPWDSVP